MSDRRVVKSNGRVADLSLEGQVEAERFVAPVLHRVVAEVTPILTAGTDAGRRDRELAYGQGFEVLEARDGFAFGHAARDGFVGYVRLEDLSDRMAAPTHRVVSPSYWFSTPSLKDPGAAVPVPVGALVAVAGVSHDSCDWAEVRVPDDEVQGDFAVYMPMPHLVSLDVMGSDLVAEAERYLGVPYLWGGNSGFGIDCSGLVQAACLACGIVCPGDSDQQAAGLGEALDDSADLQRGDLIFWRGHVALVVGDGRILHANAHHMAVAYEDMESAIARIAAKDGAVTGWRRIAS
jgi:hypothetical protein